MKNTQNEQHSHVYNINTGLAGGKPTVAACYTVLPEMGMDATEVCVIG